MTSWMIFVVLCMYDTPCDPDNHKFAYTSSGKFDTEIECILTKLDFQKLQIERLKNLGKDDLWIGQCEKVEIDVR